jgi:uncharacterized protein with PIN domain
VDSQRRSRFVADAMLGTLAKWLRILGFDTLFDPEWDDDQLVRLARAEGRVLLSRDTDLARRRGLQVLLIESQDLEEQLQQVFRDLHLKPDRAFSRCPVCNEPLEPMDLEAARDQVPAYVARTQDAFKTCPTCHRVYWRGTHWQQMEEQIAQLWCHDSQDTP